MAGTKQGLKQDEDYSDDPGFAARGNILEDNWTVPLISAWAQSMGAELIMAGQANQTTLIMKKLRLSVTPDGVIKNFPKKYKLGKTVLVEFKSIDPRFNAANLPKPEHISQVQQGMGILRKSKEFADVTHALIFYVNASIVTVTDPFVVEFDPETFASYSARAKKALTTPFEKLPLEGKLKFGGKPCRYCPFKSRCGVQSQKQKAN